MNTIDLKFYLSIFWKRLPLFLIVWAAVASLAVFIAYVLPPVYRSEARILVQSPQIPANLAESTVSIGSEEVIQTIKQRLMTRDNLLDIADRFGVFDDEPDLSPTDKVGRMHAAAALELLSLGERRRRGPPSALAFIVSFESPNAALSAQVTNELVTLILERNLEIRTDRATQTADFFKSEVDRLSGELATIEGEITEFKIANFEALPDSLNFRRQEMSRIQAALLRLETQELALLDQRDQIRQAIADPAFASALSGRRETQEERDLAELKRLLAQRQAIFSDTHPQITTLKSEIAVLEEIIGGVDAADNPSIIAMEIEIDQIEKNLELIAKQRVEFESEIVALEKSVADTPTVEMQLNALQRTRSTTQSELNAAQNGLVAANTGEVIETRQKGESFEVIEYASLPEDPVSPPRLIIAAGGIGGGVFVGLGLLVLLELLNSTIRRPAEITRALGIQPFATIPYIATRGEIIRNRLRTALGIGAVALGIPALLMFIHYQYMPLDLIIDRIATRFGVSAIFS